MKPDLPLEEKCFGCGACVNICPVDALTMKYSNNGFLLYKLDDKRCIGCGKCTKTCPSLNPSFKNNDIPAFYAYCAHDDIRELSSSGGMFLSLAHHVIDSGGVVCGAAFENGLQLKHSLCISKSELPKYCGSKYLQSDVGYCYREIKKILSNNKTVLFVGTPCQVAGLYGVVGSNNDNLITCDLLCHGVPSQLFFDSYVSELSNKHGKQIVNIEFRNKKISGWDAAFIATFSDGDLYIGKKNTSTPDPYLNGFYKNLMSRYTCYNCPFSKYPRQGDITIGDLWHANELCPGSNDKKGTSFVFVNNPKGELFFSQLKTNATFCQLIELKKEQYNTIPNRVTPKAWINPNRKRFINLIKRNTLSRSVALSLEGKYDIGLPCVLYTDNVGSLLTYYSLYKSLTDIGYTVKLIEKPLDSELAKYEYKEAHDFCAKRIPKYDQPVQFESISLMYELNNICDFFLVGSDQVFMMQMNMRRNNMFFLEFVKKNKKKIAFSTSHGGPGARGTADYYEKLKYHLNTFEYLSCREDDGVNFANNSLNLRKH